MYKFRVDSFSEDGKVHSFWSSECFEGFEECACCGKSHVRVNNISVGQILVYKVVLNIDGSRGVRSVWREIVDLAGFPVICS